MNNNIPEYVPEYLSIIRENERVIMRRRWFSWRYTLQALFLLFLVIVFVPEIAEIESNIWKGVIISVVGSCFIIVVYYVLTKLVNSTFIYLDPQHISIIHKPLPFLFAKNLKIKVGDLVRIIQEQKRHNGRTRRKYYEISAITPDNEKIKLLSDIDIEAQAYFIKKEIERFFSL